MLIEFFNETFYLRNVLEFGADACNNIKQRLGTVSVCVYRDYPPVNVCIISVFTKWANSCYRNECHQHHIQIPEHNLSFDMMADNSSCRK